MTTLAQYDPNLLEKLGLTVEQAQELEAQGISLEQYAETMQDAAQLEENAEILPVRYRIVAQAAAFQNEATGEIIQKLRVRVPFFHTSRVLFAPQNEGESAPPLCTSHDGKLGRYVADDGLISYRKCQGCPFDQFGSDPNGGRGKACKTVRRIYLLEENSQVPAILGLPPSSHRAWDQFVSALRFRGQLVSSYEIELSLETKRNGAFVWSQLQPPKIIRELSPAEKFRVVSIGKELEARHKTITMGIEDYLQVNVENSNGATAEETAQGETAGHTA
ncbi:hypothetical protein [Alicyclobacillus acidocaldarius]|uniref:Uncharacterized protein n=1 Tax=Alicyclobacillus acidocaldarius subsp. acidocaldarius (strain ATCC 27009 / DSM 446 / BCRC 14685 / JCM 5260 / KCTC 1825 / NBRC 15652 / NCIMB 11725 / NRRL B-14509 / 104-IA) TaxID=521098 RepID=C8WVI9_ALIAD|nr:hypothetical protein [Alicyclobacillus acidocaldarius]ACV58111.1 hypothetical protein Aaci_1074 [Alicyclobacillus acidocaldarius subsp. acidocaldarius DSM 446]